jgi:DNA-binding CsgD family transcriptional regulator
MHDGIDTSGDAQILQMMEFAHGAFRASSVVFYWVNETTEMFGFRWRGVPREFVDRYRAGMDRLDPLLVRRLAERKRRVAWLREEAVRTPDLPTYIEFLNAYGFIDNLEFVFWNEDGPFAGLGLLRSGGDAPLEATTLDVGAVHKYLEFNMLMHPRQREMRLRTTLARRFRLTQREIETVSLMCAGASNHEVAEMMGVRLATAKTHVVNVLDKLGVDNRSSVVGLMLSLQ